MSIVATLRSSFSSQLNFKYMDFKMKENNDWIKVYINDTLHLFLNKKKLSGFQSWKFGKEEWCIEFSYPNLERRKDMSSNGASPLPPNSDEKPATKGYNIRKRSGKYCYKYIYKPKVGARIEADLWGDTWSEVVAKIMMLNYQNESNEVLDNTFPKSQQ